MNDELEMKLLGLALIEAVAQNDQDQMQKLIEQEPMVGTYALSLSVAIMQRLMLTPITDPTTDVPRFIGILRKQLLAAQ